MSKKELIAELSSLGYDNEQLNGLQRPKLLEKLQAHKAGDEGLAALQNVDEEDDVGVEVNLDAKDIVDDFGEPLAVEPTDIPTPNDPGWTQYVLGNLLEDEVDGKNPRVEGLRRIAGELVGELVEEGCDLVAAPTEANRFRACAKAWGIFVTSEGITKRFEALADANCDNCFEDFATYLVAMADTRAKGRMFRNALCLRRVVAAEEVSKTVATAADIQSGGSVHTGQISMIRVMAGRMGISISKLLDNMGIEHKTNEQSGEVNLKSISYEEAMSVTKKLNELRQSSDIPEELKENNRGK